MRKIYQEKSTLLCKWLVSAKHIDINSKMLNQHFSYFIMIDAAKSFQSQIKNRKKC